MKETKKSLKAYFVILGSLWVLYGLYQIIVYPDIMNVIAGFTNLILGVMLFYYGYHLFTYLRESPETLVNFIIILSVIGVIYSSLSGQILDIIINIISRGVLAWYLIGNIKKLSKKDNNIENKK